MEQSLQTRLSELARIKEDIKNAINDLPGTVEPVGDDFSTYAAAINASGARLEEELDKIIRG